MDATFHVVARWLNAEPTKVSTDADIGYVDEIARIFCRTIDGESVDLTVVAGGWASAMKMRRDRRKANHAVRKPSRFDLNSKQPIVRTFNDEIVRRGTRRMVC